MVLPGLLSVLFVYHYMQKPVVQVYQQSVMTGTTALYLSHLMGKPTIYLGENKGADKLRGKREADQRLCFRYSDSTIPPLLNSKISSF